MHRLRLPGFTLGSLPCSRSQSSDLGLGLISPWLMAGPGIWLGPGWGSLLARLLLAWSHGAGSSVQLFMLRPRILVFLALHSPLPSQGGDNCTQPRPQEH